MYVLYQNPNFLIFDEPTNDLDLPTLTVLENFLLNFQGSLIIVSHDRYFMDRIVDHILAFEGEGIIKDFVGNFSEYREKKSQESGKNQPEIRKDSIKNEIPAASVTAEKPATNKRKLSFKEQRELEMIDKELPVLDKKRNEILEKLNNETDYEKISVYSAELERISGKMEEMEMRWLELQD